MEIICKSESYSIIGACFEVYKEKGGDFLEAVYQECLEIELAMRGIPFSSQEALNIEYKGKPLKQYYTPDFNAAADLEVGRDLDQIDGMDRRAAGREDHLSDFGNKGLHSVTSRNKIAINCSTAASHQSIRSAVSAADTGIGSFPL